MSARGMLLAMIAGTALIPVFGGREAPPPRPVPAPRAIAERPWLGKPAVAQLFGEDGGPGPLFTAAILGGTAPIPALRAHIAEFARKHDVDIELDVRRGELVGIEVGVTFGGCCGYEGADVLALRLGRPSTGNSCMGDDRWIDAWRFTTADGVLGRAEVDVNRVTVRWERQLGDAELLELAEGLLGRTLEEARTRSTITPGAVHGTHAIDVAYPFAWQYRRDRVFEPALGDGLTVTVAAGRITEVSLPLRDHHTDASTLPAAHARWGRPRTHGEALRWRTAEHTIETDLETGRLRLRAGTV